MNIRKTLGSLLLAGSLAYAVSPALAQGPTSAYAAQQAQAGVIDSAPADNGKYRTQKAWISYFNEHGKSMISAPDIYKAAQTGSDELIKSLQEDFKKQWLVTNTRIKYVPDSLDARIVHNYGSNTAVPTESKVVVPAYEDGTKLGEVLGTPNGLAYMRALFNTADGAEEITKTLERLGGKNADMITICTPAQDKRAIMPERAAGFNSYDGRFDASSHWVADFHIGRSRGISK